MKSNNEKQKITLLHDEPLINDKDLSPRIKALINIIDNIFIDYRQKIKVFAVFGNWGTGKTSVIRSVHQYFEVRNQSREMAYILPIWFDAWRYQHEADIYPALLREVGDAIEKFVPEKKKLGKTIKNTANNILNFLYTMAYATKIKTPIINFSGKDALDKARGFSEEGNEPKLSEQLATVAESPYFEAINLLRRVPAELEQQENKGHVIIFIDDLDRCLPNIAFNLIEKLKIWIDMEGYTICLALNDNEIEKVVMKYFSEHLEIPDETLEKVANDYLLKVCPLVIYVDENNENLKKIMDMEIDTTKQYSEVAKTMNSKMSYREKKSNYNITILENLVRDKISQENGGC